MPCAACLVANIIWHSAQSSPAYTLPAPLLSEHFHHQSPWALSVFHFTNVRKLLAFLFHRLSDYTCNVLAPEHLTPQRHHILLWAGMGGGQSSTPFPRVATRLCGHLLPDGLSVFVSCDCCDKTPQNEWLTTPKTFSLPAREARVWDQSVSRGSEPPKALREAPSCLSGFWGPNTPTSASVFTWPPPLFLSFPHRLSNLPLRRTPVIGVRVHPGNQDKLLNSKSLVTSSETLFLNKVPFSGLRSGRGQCAGDRCSAHRRWWLAMSYCSKHHLVHTALCCADTSSAQLLEEVLRLEGWPPARFC